MLTPIQTFWIENNNYSGGWTQPKFNFFSWALSSSLLVKTFGSAVLYTNQVGADLLIGDLDLPYKVVDISLDEYKNDFPNISVIKKLRTYSLQKSPFLHVDGDAYFFRSLPTNFDNAEIIAQNVEFDHPYYLDSIETINSSFPYIPQFTCRGATGKILAVNAGVVGGNNNKFFVTLYLEAVRFLEKNRNHLQKLTTFSISTYLEQYLLKQLANSKGLNIETILEREVGYPYNYDLDRFTELPNRVDFLHTMNYKRNVTINEQVAQRLWIEEPNLYERCVHAAEKLASVKFYYSATSKDHFSRTTDACKYLLKRFDKKNGLDDNGSFEYVLDAIEGPERKARLLDLFQFERAKMEFVQALPLHDTIESDWKVASRRVNEVLSLPSSEYECRTLLPQENSLRIASYWSWAEQTELSKDAIANDFSMNERVEEAYFETLIYYTTNTRRVREMSLDTINILLLDDVTGNKTYKEIMNNVMLIIRTANSQLSEEAITEMLGRRLKFFLYMGIIAFS
jgi:hypothetical protein